VLLKSASIVLIVINARLCHVNSYKFVMSHLGLAYCAGLAWFILARACVMILILLFELNVLIVNMLGKSYSSIIAFSPFPPCLALKKKRKQNAASG
jgi:hypothetical protein